jgi:hypothetical protein
MVGRRFVEGIHAIDAGQSRVSNSERRFTNAAGLASEARAGASTHLVCFLAYAMLKMLEGWTKRAALGSSIATVLEEFARVQSTDVVIPTADGRQVRLRCIVHPDAAQKTLLDRLGLTLATRVPKGVCQM